MLFPPLDAFPVTETPQPQEIVRLPSNLSSRGFADPPQFKAQTSALSPIPETLNLPLPHVS